MRPVVVLNPETKIMTVWRIGTLLALAGCFVGAAAANDQAAGAKKAGQEKGVAARPLPLSGFADAATFHLYSNEDPVATMTISWKADGTYDSHFVLSFAGQSVKGSSKIVPSADGIWKTIQIESPRGNSTITREGNTAHRVSKTRNTTIKLKPNTALFDNYSPLLICQAIRAYDPAKAGKQTIPVLVLPGALVDATIERLDAVERNVGSRDVKLSRYVYSLGGVEITVWLDPAGKLLLADVPSQRAAYVRDGFEALRKVPETDPLISKPTFRVKTDPNVGVAMRDGTKLSTTIYRPDSPGKFPVILIRTPYKKEMLELQAAFYARRGYAVAVQDCRGRFGSSGEWEPFVNEPRDGYDTVEWLAAEPWSQGKVGMIGGSYVGWVQWWAAVERPPHLVTIIPNVAPPDPFYNIPYEYGVFFLGGAIWWADVLETAATADLSGAALAKIGEKKYKSILRQLPVIDLDQKVLGRKNKYWRKWIEHPNNDEYWEQANFLEKLHDVNIPVFHQSGWFDGDGIGTKLNYQHMHAHHARDQKLVLGPWGHSDRASRMYGDHDFGPDAMVDLPRDYLRWFDHYLKSVDNGINREPLVGIYVMGSNHWLHGNEYPLPSTQFEKWYLDGAGKANTSHGDGRLRRELPGDEPPDHYTYDPGDPTPDPSFYEEPEDRDKQPQSSEEVEAKQKAYHEALSSTRPDVLVYVTEPFKEPYTFAGPVSAVLYASTSAKDTDWFMSLMELDQKGKIFHLAQGKIRARFRESMRTPQMLVPGQVSAYALDLWHTGITVPKNHRLRVEISSALFPTFSRNLNTGGHNETETKFVPAQQTVYHSKLYPSHILLPAIPQGDHKER
jgi:uncharacterized protein